MRKTCTCGHSSSAHFVPVQPDMDYKACCYCECKHFSEPARQDRSWMWGVLVVLAGIIAVSLGWIATAKGAPAPIAKSPPPVEIVDGDWILDWSGTSEPFVLDGGTSTWGPKWYGHWTWDSKKRLFSASDRLRGSENRLWLWEVTLDADGKGVTSGKDWPGTKVKFRRPLKRPKVTD